jgi:galactokinase
MNQHQGYLRDDLKVSIPKLDQMIDAAREAGAIGAKLVGSGGGGCAVALAPGREEQVRLAMLEAGAVDAFEVKVVQPVNLDS